MERKRLNTCEKRKKQRRRYKDKCFSSLWLTCLDSRSLKAPWDCFSSFSSELMSLERNSLPPLLNTEPPHTHAHLHADYRLQVTSPKSPLVSGYLRVVSTTNRKSVNASSFWMFPSKKNQTNCCTSSSQKLSMKFFSKEPLMAKT